MHAVRSGDRPQMPQLVELGRANADNSCCLPSEYGPLIEALWSHERRHRPTAEQVYLRVQDINKRWRHAVQQAIASAGPASPAHSGAAAAAATTVGISAAASSSSGADSAAVSLRPRDESLALLWSADARAPPAEARDAVNAPVDIERAVALCVEAGAMPAQLRQSVFGPLPTLSDAARLASFMDVRVELSVVNASKEALRCSMNLSVEQFAAAQAVQSLAFARALEAQLRRAVDALGDPGATAAWEAVAFHVPAGNALRVGVDAEVDFFGAVSKRSFGLEQEERLGVRIRVTSKHTEGIAIPLGLAARSAAKLTLRLPEPLVLPPHTYVLTAPRTLSAALAGTAQRAATLWSASRNEESKDAAAVLTHRLLLPVCLHTHCI